MLESRQHTEGAQKFDAAMGQLLSARDSLHFAAAYAVGVEEAMSLGKLQLLFEGARAQTPAITEVSLDVIQRGGHAVMMPTITVYMNNVTSSHEAIVAGDLLRSCVIAQEFSHAASYGEVYERGIMAQTLWLQQTQPPLPTNTDLDPRDTRIEAITRRLVGDARYFSDTSFTDWQKAILFISSWAQTANDFATLTEAGRALPDFLALRERILPRHFARMVQGHGEEYTETWNQEKRSELAAREMLFVYLKLKGVNITELFH